ncbi:TPA: hypothetical protein ACRZRH_002943 [Legionella pneumophila]
MLTTFLTTVIGWYLVIVSLFLLFHNEHAKSAMAEIIAHRGSQLIMAIVTLITGLLLVVSHNIWVMGWPVVITLFAWLVLLGGLIRFLCPDTAVRVGQSFVDNPIRLKIAAVIFFIIGLFLLFNVYYVYLK